MKRLGAFIFSTILLVSVLGVFPALKVHAQETSQTSNSVTNDQIIQHVENGLFQQTQLALANEKSAIISRKNTPQYQSDIATNTAEMTAFVKAKSAFEDYLLSNGDLPIEQRYPNSLQTAAVALAQFQQSSTPLQQGAGKDFVTKFTDQLNLEAKNMDWIRAITTGQAVSADSQLAANATTQAANPSSPSNKPITGQCTWYNFTISACIDEGFAWFIRNTILQLAGFLVWLTANMLNYAISISILDFAKWAPDSLYPIWMVVRQIISLFVVFAGLYLGFMYIIGQTEKFGKYVGWLVLYALFVNFSYPISRMLIDVSNIISLNVYSASVGADTLTGTVATGSTAGGMIMAKLGLQSLVASATDVAGVQKDFIGSINSTPGALIAVAFVLYAAYIFFIATAIIATRTAVLVFLTVASPLLLVDSVVPKLGEVAAKIRKMFFEQLAVAPVFTIMLALTLKFMDVFQKDGALSSSADSVKALAASGNGAGIQSFFSILMMLIMLHIMLKVTKSLAGEAGQYATNFMGKVGGFGLAAATMGTGVLARGTIGAAAARARDSGWMDKMQGNAAGRGLYTLTHSLAQSTYDARNLGMVSGGLKKAGLTGGFGMTMQKPTVKNFDAAKEARSALVEKKAVSIKDDTTRESYLKNANKGRLVRLEDERLKEVSKSIADKKQAQLAEMMTTTDPRKRETLINQAVLAKDYAMADKLRVGDQYLKVNNNNPAAATEKAKLLKQMSVDETTAKLLVDKDPFADLQKAHNQRVEEMKEKLAGMKRDTAEEKAAYKDAKDAIEKTQTEHEVNIANLKKATMNAFSAASQQQAPIQEPTRPAPTYSGPAPTQIPAVQRMNTANNPPRPANIPLNQPVARTAPVQGRNTTPTVNEVAIETSSDSGVTSFNGVRNQSFAQHMEEVRRNRQRASVESFSPVSSGSNTSGIVSPPVHTSSTAANTSTQDEPVAA